MPTPILSSSRPGTPTVGGGGNTSPGFSQRALTNLGREIDVWVPDTHIVDDQRRYFCHGHAFGTYQRYRYSPFSGSAVEMLLADEYEQIPEGRAQYNDVIVWRRTVRAIDISWIWEYLRAIKTVQPSPTSPPPKRHPLLLSARVPGSAIVLIGDELMKQIKSSEYERQSYVHFGAAEAIVKATHRALNTGFTPTGAHIAHSARFTRLIVKHEEVIVPEWTYVSSKNGGEPLQEHAKLTLVHRDYNEASFATTLQYYRPKAASTHGMDIWTAREAPPAPAPPVLLDAREPIVPPKTS